MTVVLKFPLEKVSRPGTKTVQENDATILLFEGVRYDPDDTSKKILAKAD